MRENKNIVVDENELAKLLCLLYAPVVFTHIYYVSVGRWYELLHRYRVPRMGLVGRLEDASLFGVPWLTPL